MEIILAIVVSAAVIIFGALISRGNERQRKAIDALREQTELWAVQDLLIKRERLAREVRVDDPLAWLSRVATRVSGLDLNLQFVESHDEPRALLCMAGDQNSRILFSPLDPHEIQRLKRGKRSRLTGLGANNPLFSLPHKVAADELSILNAGILFDLELQLAWKGLTGQSAGQLEKIWMYRE
jgi:hypothetical protein